MLQAIFHGHSFVELLTKDNESILIDPFVTGNPKCDLTLDDLQKKSIIAILVTHGHADHLGDTVTLKSMFPIVPVYTTTGVASYLTEHGCGDCHGGSIGGTLVHHIFTTKLVQAIHDGSIMDSGRSTTPSGMIIRIEDKCIYHMGDTALTKDFELIGEHETVDLAFVPIGGYYTMDMMDAVRATQMIHPKIVAPMHYNTRPHIQADDMEFARQIMLNKYAVPKVLRPGQSVILE